MSKLLSVENLHIKIIKENCNIVKGISFSIAAGDTLVLLGQSGSGKSMTCRAIMGLLDTKRFLLSGSVRYKNMELLDISKVEKRRIYGGEIAFVPQNPMTALDPSMKIESQMDETLNYHTNTNRKERKERIAESLHRAGLDDIKTVLNSYPYMLSGGMLQRVIIAMALMSEAKLIIADEPTTALDVVHRNETIDEFLRLKDQGIAIFMVTHDFAAASQLGGQLCIMNDGELVEQGALDEVLRQPGHDYTKALIAASSLSESSTLRRLQID